MKIPPAAFLAVSALVMGFTSIILLSEQSQEPPLPISKVNKQEAGPAASVNPIRDEAVSTRSWADDAQRVETGSQGSMPSFHWCVGPAPAVRPCPELRERFDAYLSKKRVNQPVLQIRQRISADAQSDMGVSLAHQVLDVFDRYWTLKNHPLEQAGGFQGHHEWASFHAARWSLRRELLGQDWADVFFSQEEFMEREWQATRAINHGDPLTPVPTDQEAWPQHSVQSRQSAAWVKSGGLRAMNAQMDSPYQEQAAGNARLSVSLSEWERLQNAQELSDNQKRSAMQQYMERR